jgi:hypothetical protein
VPDQSGDEGPRSRWRRAADGTDDDLPLGRPVDDPRRQVRGQNRSGHEGPTELFEDDGSRRHSEAHPAGGLGNLQREHPGLGQLAPSLGVEQPGPTLGGAQPVQREATGAQAADPRGQGRLVLGELEVHATPL